MMASQVNTVSRCRWRLGVVGFGGIGGVISGQEQYLVRTTTSFPAAAPGCASISARSITSIFEQTSATARMGIHSASESARRFERDELFAAPARRCPDEPAAHERLRKGFVGQAFGAAAELLAGAELYVRAGSAGDLVAGVNANRVFNGVTMALRATEMHEEAARDST